MTDRVQGPYVGAGPRGFKRPPNRLEGAVCDALRANSYVDASEIDVEVKPESEEAVLGGTVPTPEQQRLAEECVVALEGISVVHNLLTVGSRPRSAGSGAGEQGE